MYVRQFMTSQVFTVTPEESIADTMTLMRDKKITKLPVMDKGKLVGFLTDGDLREVAVKKVITCQPDMQLEDAALLMREHEIGGLPVLDEGKLVGIITGSDILDAFLDIMGSRSPGQRVVIITKDKSGVMLDLAVTIKEFDVDISSIAVYHLKDNQIQILARFQGEQVDRVKASLAQKGYSIT